MKVLKWVRIAVFLLALVLVLAHVAGEEEEEGNFVGRSEHYAELNHLGRLEEAVEAAAEAAALAPQDPNVLSDLGALLQQLNRLDEAQAVLLAALKIEPNHFNALNNLAVTLIAAGSLVEAEVPLRRALLLVQGSSSTESAVFHNLVSLLRDSGRQEEAEVELRGMMELPEGPAGDFLLAVAQLHLQRSRHLYRVGNLAKEYGIPVDQDGYEDLWTQLMKLQHSFPSSINTLVAWRGYRGDLLDASKIYLDLSLPDAVMTPMEEAAKFGPAGTGIHLIVQYYLAGDKARQREMDDCLIINLANVLIETVHVLLDGGGGLTAFHTFLDAHKTGINRDKLQVVDHGERLTFYQAFKYAEENLRGKLVILANSDIYFDSSLGSLGLTDRLNMTRRVFALCRWEGEVFIPRTDSQDSWIFRPPLSSTVLALTNFELGRPRCDSRLAAVLRDAGYDVTSPSIAIRSHHVYYTDQGRSESYGMAEQVPGEGAQVKISLQWLF